MRDEFSLNLRIGVFITVALLLFLAFLFGLGGRHGLFEKTYVVQTKFPNTAGLTEGAVVRFAGVGIGTVTKIYFPKDTEEPYVIVRMEVSKEGMRRIGPDSMATIKTEGLLGDKYIDILRGEAKPPEKVPDFIEIGSYSYPEFDRLLGQSDKLLQNIIGISEGLRDIVGGFKEKENIENISKAVASLRRTVEEIETGRGPLHTLIYGGVNKSGEPVEYNVVGRLDEAMFQLNTLISEIRHGKGLLNSLIYDESLKTEFEETLHGLNSTIGVFAGEEGVARELERTIRNLRVISEKVSGGEGTLGALISDPALYDRLTGVMGEAERSRFIRAAVRYLVDKQKKRAPKE